MSASQVLKAPTYYTTLAPNDALQDPNFCNQCKPWKLIALNVFLKTFTKLMYARKSRFSPNTPDPLCAKDTRHLMCFARNGSIRRSTHPWHRLSLKFEIFICDRKSNTRQKNRARTNLLNKTKIKQDHSCCSLYICHTKAITTLVEYGTKCLYEDTNFYSVLIVRSAFWLKVKSSHFRKCYEENFYLCVRLMQKRMEIFSTAAKLFVWRLRLTVQKTESSYIHINKSNAPGNSKRLYTPDVVVTHHSN